MPKPKMKIFWDLETCPMSTSYASLGEVLKDIRRFTSDFGVVTSIKAYWDRNRTRSPNDPLRSAMPSMGVNLVDCASMPGYTKDALTKMLSVDIVMSAVDGPISSEVSEDDIIMIISGDKSVLYPISLLMFRNYTVFLAVPDDNVNVQSSQATRMFSWYRDILGSGVSPPPVPVSIVEALQSPGWIVNGTHVPQLSLDSPSMSPPFSNAGPRSIPSTHASSPRPMTTVTSPVATPKSKDRSVPPSDPPSSRALSPLSVNSDPPRASKPLTSFATAIPAPRPDHRLNRPESNKSHSNPVLRDSRLRADDEAEDPMDRAAEEWAAAAGGWDVGGSWGMAGQNWVTAPAPKSETKSKDTTRKADHTKQETRSMADNKKSQAPSRTSVPVKEAKTFGVKVNDVQIDDPPMSVFDPLMQILGEAQNQAMMRSQLGEHLAKRKGLYESAGVNGFGEYIALAVKRQIIVWTGTDNHQQVKLKKRR